MGNDSIKRTLIVALAMCIICSVIVSTAAVMLKPAQQANKQLDFNKNILAAAGMMQEGADVAELLKQITPKLVDLDSGKYISVDAVEDIANLEIYDQNRSAKVPSLSDKLSAEQDIAKIIRREKYAKVYVVENAAGGVDKVVLPIKGYGLWGQLYGFLALESDLNTVIGIGFYDHKETPGLGGEVDNPNWKAVWVGKQMYSADGSIALRVLKGKALKSSKSDIDGLSGATLTTRGVNNLFHFWLGDNGYGPFLSNLKKGEA